MRRARSSRGTTVVELGTAVALVAVSILGTAAAVSDAHAEDVAEPRSLACLMDDIRQTDPADVVAAYHGTSHDVRSFGAEGAAGAASVQVAEIDDAGEATYCVTIHATFPDVEPCEIVTYVSAERAAR